MRALILSGSGTSFSEEYPSAVRSVMSRSEFGSMVYEINALYEKTHMEIITTLFPMSISILFFQVVPFILYVQGLLTDNYTTALIAVPLAAFGLVSLIVSFRYSTWKRNRAIAAFERHIADIRIPDCTLTVQPYSKFDMYQADLLLHISSGA